MYICSLNILKHINQDNMADYKIQGFPDSRIASMDVCEIGKHKHHITAILEFDVTESRRKIREYNKNNPAKISFNAWLIHVIARTIKKHETASSYLIGKKKLIIFNDINISVIVEKSLNGTKVPFPLVIEKANEISIESIAAKISMAKEQVLTPKRHHASKEDCTNRAHLLFASQISQIVILEILIETSKVCLQ